MLIKWRCIRNAAGGVTRPKRHFHLRPALIAILTLLNISIPIPPIQYIYQHEVGLVPRRRRAPSLRCAGGPTFVSLKRTLTFSFFPLLNSACRSSRDHPTPWSTTPPPPPHLPLLPLPPPLHTSSYPTLPVPTAWQDRHCTSTSSPTRRSASSRSYRQTLSSRVRSVWPSLLDIGRTEEGHVGGEWLVKESSTSVVAAQLGGRKLALWLRVKLTDRTLSRTPMG